MTAIYSDLDQVVVPTNSDDATTPDLQACNLLFRGIGHMSLPRHGGVVDEAAATLAGVRGPVCHTPAVHPIRRCLIRRRLTRRPRPSTSAR